MNIRCLRIPGMLVVAACAVALAGPAAFPEPARANIHTAKMKALHSTVQVITETRFGTIRRSTGYLYAGSGYVATAFHAVSDAERITVFHADHGIYPVYGVRFLDVNSNIAVLSLDETLQLSVSCAQIADTREAAVGDDVFVFHHPARSERVVQQAKLLGTAYAEDLPEGVFRRNFAQGHELIEVSGVFDSGSAGGLLLNSTYGVLGVLVAASERGAWALSARYVQPMMTSSTNDNLLSLRTDYAADAEFHDHFFGPAPRRADYKDGMLQGYLAWFPPINHVRLPDVEFTAEINNIIDKSWFMTGDIVVDNRPLREWSASRLFIWDVSNNPWGITANDEQFLMFDADSRFSKIIYKERETEERIVARYIVTMPLDPGSHSLSYNNTGANFKATGTKRKRIEIVQGRVETIDLHGLSLVSMMLLEAPQAAVGEEKPVRYELERHMIGDKELMAGVRLCRIELE